MAVSRITRRNFLRAGAAALLPCFPSCDRRKPPTTAAAEAFHWSGIGFGIDMSMEIHGVDRGKGERLGTICEDTIRSLEQAFSLYQENSELRILNRERVLRHPSPLFRELLTLSLDLHRRTSGSFNPAVHGAWQWLQERGSSDGLADDPQWSKLIAATDPKFIDFSSAVRLRHPLTQLSMNAIGQGFLADTVAARLRAEGVTTAMLHLGESRAIGSHPEGRPWRLAVMGTTVDGETDLVGSIEFADAGLAVSANEADRILIDPVAGRVHRRARVAAVVSAEGAAVADAFATAFGAAPRDEWKCLVSSLEEGGASQVHVWENNVPALRKP